MLLLRILFGGKTPRLHKKDFVQKGYLSQILSPVMPLLPGHKYQKGVQKRVRLHEKLCDEMFCFSSMHVQCSLLDPFWVASFIKGMLKQTRFDNCALCQNGMYLCIGVLFNKDYWKLYLNLIFIGCWMPKPLGKYLWTLGQRDFLTIINFALQL